MPKTFIGVRDVDEETFRRFRARALAEKIKLGDALTMLMIKYLKEKEKRKEEHWKKVLALAEAKPLNFGPGNERLSEQVDEILYGWKKNDSS